MLNAISIDLEEWFCVTAFDRWIRRDDWAGLESRIEPSTTTILELLERHGTRATFFTLGWVAERHPAVIRSIADAGHEVACHGYDHRQVTSLTPSQFKEDLLRSKRLLEELSGRRCVGYRAPTFSLRTDCEWAWETLAELGFDYDSSIYPVRHDRYGEPDAPRFAHWRPSGDSGLIEFPPSTVRLLGTNFPVGGGGYLRLYPLGLSRWAVRRINREGRPAVIYFHPWELDPQHPRPPQVGSLTLARHRIGIASMEGKLDSLLRTFSFGPLSEVLQHAPIARPPVQNGCGAGIMNS